MLRQSESFKIVQYNEDNLFWPDRYLVCFLYATG